MTSQTKTFIEFGDIIGLRVECKTCGCSLLVEIERSDGTIDNLLAKNNTILSNCPTCQAEWTELRNRSILYDTEVKEFLRQLRDLRKLTDKFGCRFTFEIKKEEPRQSISQTSEQAR